MSQGSKAGVSQDGPTAGMVILGRKRGNLLVPLAKTLPDSTGDSSPQHWGIWASAAISWCIWRFC